MYLFKTILINMANPSKINIFDGFRTEIFFPVRSLKNYTTACDLHEYLCFARVWHLLFNLWAGQQLNWGVEQKMCVEGIGRLGEEEKKHFVRNMPFKQCTIQVAQLNFLNVY